MEKPNLDPQEWIFSLSDVKQLYISMRRRLLKGAVLGALLAFLFFGSSPPQYKAESTFKEGVEKSSSESFLKEIIVGMGTTSQPQAVVFMKSYQVLRPLVEKMGLQIKPVKSEWMLKKIYRRFRDTLKAEKGQPLEDLDSFAFSDVLYEEEKGLSFHLSFTDPTHFKVYAADRRKELDAGIIGEKIQLQEPPLQFTVQKIPKALKIGAFYPFQVGHWFPMAESIRSQIKIVSDKLNTSLYNISFTSRDRHFCTRIVNELMHQYQRYLKKEYDQLAKEQLTYLENKQGQIYGQMEQLFDQQASYLTRNLEEKGFVGLEEEAEELLLPHRGMQNKVLQIDIELARLDQIEKEGKAVAVGGDGASSKQLNQICQKIQDLKQKRDLLELSFSSPDAMSESSLTARKEELREIRNQRYEIDKWIEAIDKEGEIAALDIREGLSFWAKAFPHPQEREDLAEYLENYARLLSLREKILQERFFYGKTAPQELEGIDLSSASSLFLQYNTKLDAAEAAMHHFERLKKEIHQPDFDLASLSSVLKDPLCQKIIGDAIGLGMQLKDEKHHSSKEAERWQEEIALQRRILSDQLEQLYKVEELNSSLIREKMDGLQKLSLDCINQQISVLYEQATDSVKAHRQALLLEKKLLEKKMGEIRKSLATVLPEKWRCEKWLKIKTEMVGKMMETVTEVVESKTISTHLHHVESKPLDRAVLPRLPLKPRLYIKSFVGAFALSFILFFFAFVRRLLKGFPLSLEKLRALHLPILGSVSAFCDGPSVETPTGPDLELLRKMALFSEGGQVIGLVSGRGPDYSYALGENLARMSIKPILVRCDFLSKFRTEDGPGLLQMWQGEIAELPIRQGKGFDTITAGGYTPYGTELIQSQTFSHLLDLLKKKYERVYLLLRTPLSSAESIAALRLCDRAIVTISGEKMEELTPFIDWGYHENECRLTLIAYP